MDAVRFARGLTLIELVMALAIGAILLGLGAPALRDFLEDSELSATTNRFVGDLNFARTEALTRRTPVVMCRSLDASAALPACASDRAAGWETGWFVFQDPNGTGAPGASSDVLRSAPGDPTQLSIRGSVDAASRIAFSRLGLSAERQIVVCGERAESRGRYVRVVAVGVGGRVQVTSGDDHSQDARIASCVP